MRTGTLVATTLVGACLLAAGPASGSDTQWWITDSPADHAKSESRGVVVGPDGTLELGPQATSVLAESLNVIWAIAVMKDGSVALGGERGRIDRWTESGGIKPWVRLPVGQVLSLARDGDGLVAGTAPDGVIYRIGARGDTTLLARTGERYVWGLAPGANSSWYAATGTKGRLLEIEGGKSRVVLDTDESNLVSLIGDGAGGVYAGGDSKGRVIRVRRDGSVRTVFDAAEDEVRALALGADGALYAAALSATAVSEEPEEGGPKPEPAKSAVSGGRAVVYRILPDSAAAAYWSSPQPFVYALAGTPKGVLAATGNRAGLYSIERAHTSTQWLAAPQGQITALAADRQGRIFAASSNPGALWRVGPGRAARGELLSSTLDAKRVARFGKILWRGEARGGRVELETRSGNTDAPDTTWSEWRGGSAPPEGFRILSPPARYLQWKIVLIGGEPRVESVEAAWREQNLPPRIEEVTVAPQGGSFREGDLLPRSEPVTQTLPSGQKVEYSLAPSPNPVPLRALPTWARGLRTVQWRATDPNGDALRFKLQVRTEPHGSWIKLGEDLEAAAFTWDTNALPDGRYRLKVIATDEPGNAIGEERTVETLSEPFSVDNSPPSVTALEARGERSGIQVVARAEDRTSALSRIEVALDDGNWRPATPEGGLTDDREVSITARLDDVKAGEHTVSVRAVDLAGNATTRATRVIVSGGR